MSTVRKSLAPAPAKRAGEKFVTRSIPAPEIEPKRPTATMRENARTYYLRNQEANRAVSGANRARKALYVEMKDAGLDSFGLSVEVPEVGRIRVEARVDAPDQTVMDVRKLWELLEAETDPQGFEKFMETVSATKGRVEQLHGRDMAVRLTVHQSGTENVTVKELEG